MVGNKLNNITQSTHRRARFLIGLTYETSSEQIKAISEELRTYLQQHTSINDEPLVRFYEFGESSLNILVTFLVNTNEFYDFCIIKEEVNFRIMEIVESHGSSFAFPSRTLYMHTPDKV